jgi:hypothetical protein
VSSKVLPGARRTRQGKRTLLTTASNGTETELQDTSDRLVQSFSIISHTGTTSSHPTPGEVRDGAALRSVSPFFGEREKVDLRESARKVWAGELASSAPVLLADISTPPPISL